MPLHPQCKAFLDMLAAAGGPGLHEMPLDEARKVPYQMIELGGAEEPLAQVETRIIPGPVQIPVRVYRPSLAQDLPALMYFHGGGFVICNLDTHDRLCRGLANASGCAVLSVDYRLAPEHKYPAAAEDAYAATRYVAEHAAEFGIDPNRIAVGGDSAGANLATVVALMARDRGGPALKFQLLIYPVTDFTEHATQSEREYGHGYFLDVELMDWFGDQYFAADADRHLPYASPIKASDLRRLPPAMVLTGECDPLRDQGEAYADKLRTAGVAVVLKRYDGMIHPFLSLAGIVDAGRDAIKESAAAVRQALNVAAPAGV
jgi:acetyl esterase/lipase